MGDSPKKSPERFDSFEKLYLRFNSSYKELNS